MNVPELCILIWMVLRSSFCQYFEWLMMTHGVVPINMCLLAGMYVIINDRNLGRLNLYRNTHAYSCTHKKLFPPKFHKTSCSFILSVSLFPAFSFLFFFISCVILLSFSLVPSLTPTFFLLFYEAVLSLTFSTLFLSLFLVQKKMLLSLFY